VAVTHAVPPPLPADIPADLQAFVACRSARVELRDGKAKWIPVPPVLKRTVGFFLKPVATIEPLSVPGAARLSVRWALVSLELRAEVQRGRLRLDAGDRRTSLLNEVYAGVDGWAERLNTWLAHNGYRLAPLDVQTGRIVLRKQVLPGGPTQIT
jgi:hypothetical protein